MSTATNDERLTEPDDESGVIAAAELIAKELARRHFDQCYDSKQCGMCADQTPLEGSRGPWLTLKREFDKLVEDTERRVVEVGGDLTEEIDHRAVGVSEVDSVAPDLRGVYLEAFNEAAVDPGQCVICTGEHAEPHESCGHEIRGEQCPAKAD